MNKLFRLAIVVSSSFLASCAVAPKQMYDGPRLTPESEAVLIGDIGSPASRGVVYITRVDGKSTTSLVAVLASTYPYPHGVFILPGHHEIWAKFLSESSLLTVDGTLRFNAEAGRIYFIRAKLEESSTSLWIDDTFTGHVVGWSDEDKSTH